MEFYSWITIILLFEATEFPMDLGCHNIRPVQQCPRNKHEFDIRAKSLNCTGLPKTATYHCVLNENGTGLLELCANKTTIHGGVCAEFNTGGHCVQGSPIQCRDKDFPCPYTYNSTEAYKFQSCYDKVYQTRANRKVTDQRSDSVDEDSKESVKHKQNDKQNGFGNHRQNHEHNHEQINDLTHGHTHNIINNHNTSNCHSSDINILYVIIAILVTFVLCCGGYLMCKLYRNQRKKKNPLGNPSKTLLGNGKRDNVEAGLED